MCLCRSVLYWTFWSDCTGAKEGFKGSASEGLSLYPLIRSYLQHFRLFSHGDPEVVLATQSYLALAACLEELKKSMRSEADTDALALHIRTRLESFKVSFSQEHMVPKHHYTLHLPDFFTSGQIAIDAWNIWNALNSRPIFLAIFITMWCDCEIPENAFFYSLWPAPIVATKKPVGHP